MLTKPLNEKEDKEPMHVDEFITYGKISSDEDKNEDYARFVLHHFRLPAIMKFAFHEFIKENKLFCKYKGKQYRVIGASRLGDVWLTSDFSKENGYENRVMVDDCSEWQPNP